MPPQTVSETSAGPSFFTRQEAGSESVRVFLANGTDLAWPRIRFL